MSIEVTSLLFIGILLFIAKALEEGFRRIGLVPFVGSIVTGIVMGEGGLGIVHVNSIISFITSLGIVFLLFLAGAEEFEIKTKIEKKFFLSAILQLSFPFLIIVLSLYALGGFDNILLISVPLAMSSAGPLTRLLIDVGMSKRLQGNYLFYQVIIDEIIAVVMFAILQDISHIVISTVEVIAIVVAIILIGRYISMGLERLESVFKVREIEFATLISTILVIGFLADTYRFNSAIAALFLGFLLRDYLSDRPELKEKLHAFTYGFFEPLFFVSIGLYFVKITADILVVGLLLSAITMSSKVIVGGITSRLVNLNSTFNALGTAVKGGVDTSLLITALSAGYINGKEYSQTVLAITFSTIVIPILFKRINVRGGKKTEENRKVKLSQSVSDLAKELVYVTCESPLKDAVLILTEKRVRGVVVVDQNLRPMGYMSMNTVIAIDPNDYDRLKICDVYLDEIETVNQEVKVSNVLKKFRETEKPLIAVVDKEGKLTNVLYEREIMRLLISG